MPNGQYLHVMYPVLCTEALKRFLLPSLSPTHLSSFVSRLGPLFGRHLRSANFSPLLPQASLAPRLLNFSLRPCSDSSLGGQALQAEKLGPRKDLHSPDQVETPENWEHGLSACAPTATLHTRSRRPVVGAERTTAGSSPARSSPVRPTQQQDEGQRRNQQE